MSTEKHQSDAESAIGGKDVMAKHVFVLGLDERNLDALRGAPALSDCTLHPLLSVDDLVHVEEIDVTASLDAAERQLDAFDGPIDAIVGYWDFPVSSMVPILCSRRGLRSADLRAVVTCEHKYWSRLEQREAITDVPRFELVDLAHDTTLPENVDYPVWVKPVKSFSSQLAFRAENDDEFTAATAQIRESIDQVGKPFDVVLERVQLPEEIAQTGGQACMVEEAVSGQQVTVEGYSFDGNIHIYGLIDTMHYVDSPSFLRYQYPSSLPRDVTSRIEDAARRVIAQIGLEWVAFNIEFFWDPQREKLNLLEINPRHSQSHAPLFEAVDGVPNHQCMVQLALGRNPNFPHRQGEHSVAAKWFYRRFTDGTVQRAPTSREIAQVERDNPGTRVNVLVESGMRLSDLPDQDSYSFELAHIYMGAADENDLEAKYGRCVRDLPFAFND